MNNPSDGKFGRDKTDEGDADSGTPEADDGADKLILDSAGPPAREPGDPDLLELQRSRISRRAAGLTSMLVFALPSSAPQIGGRGEPRRNTPRDFKIQIVAGDGTSGPTEEDDQGRKYTTEIESAMPIPAVLTRAAEIIRAHRSSEKFEVIGLSEHSEFQVQRFLDKHLNSTTASRLRDVRMALEMYQRVIKLKSSTDPIDQERFRVLEETGQLDFLHQYLGPGYRGGTKEYYELLGEKKAYFGGRIATHTMALAAGFRTVADFLFKEDTTPRRIVSIGPGDGDAIRGLQKARRALLPILFLKERIAAPGRMLKGRSLDMLDTVMQSQTSPAFYFDSDLLGIDLTEIYPEILWSEKNIQVVSSDAGNPEIFGDHKIGKRRPKLRASNSPKSRFITLNENDWDQVQAFMVLDRVKDRHAVYENMKKMAKPGALFQFGLPTRITNENEVGMGFAHWERSRDRRSLWMHPDPAWTIYYQYADFLANGFVTRRMSLQKYVSLNPECIVGHAGDLRGHDPDERKFRRLQLESKFGIVEGSGDPIYLQILANLFDIEYPAHGIRPTFIFEDADIVLFPEIFDLTIFAGEIDKNAPTLRD